MGSAMTEVLNEHGLLGFLRAAQEGGGEVQRSETGQRSSDSAGHQLYMWGGRLRRVPQGWTYPRHATVLTGWRLWWLGNKTEGVPPYRNLTLLDLASTAEKKVFSDWKAVFGRIEGYLSETGQLSDADHVAEMYQGACDLLKRGSKRGERTDQISVLTAAKKFRKIV